MTAKDATLEAISAPQEAKGLQGLPLEKWKRLIDVFRAQGGGINYREAGRAVDIKPKTAKDNFEKGAPRLRRPPIRDILLQETVAARAASERVTTHIEERIEALGGDAATRASANKQAVAAKAQESRLLAGTRVTAEVCLGVSGKLLRAAGPITTELAARMERDLKDPKITTPALHAMMRQLFDYAKQAGDLARTAVDLERLLVGNPSTVINVTADLTTAQATEELVAAARMMKRFADESIDPTIRNELERAGVNLRVIAGGKS